MSEHTPPADFESWSPERKDRWFADAYRAYREIKARKTIEGAERELSQSRDSPARPNGNGARPAPEERAGVYVPPDGKLIHVADPAPSDASAFVPAYQRGLVMVTGKGLLQREFPPREMQLAPWLPEKGLAMIFAERGIGKTWTALNIAHGIAGGGAFLRWRAPKSRRVAYIDGEMPARTLKERYAAIVAGAPFDAPNDNFQLVAADLQPDGLPDLADPAAQRFYDRVIADAELIVIDNLSTVCRSLRENEADSWGPVQAWCLRQRAAGKSVLLIHHAGKGGAQRGTSRKEDVLDSVVSLKRPFDYNASQGARFEVHFTKSRGFFGDDAAPFEARFSDGRWEMGEIATPDDDGEAIAAMHAAGATVREISGRLGVSKSAIGRKLKGARNEPQRPRQSLPGIRAGTPRQHRRPAFVPRGTAQGFRCPT